MTVVSMYIDYDGVLLDASASVEKDGDSYILNDLKIIVGDEDLTDLLSPKILEYVEEELFGEFMSEAV